MNRVVCLLLFVLLSSSFARAQDTAQDHANRGFSLYQQGQFQKALAEFEECIKKAPARNDCYRLAGLSYFQMKDYDKSSIALKKAIELAEQTQQEDNAAKIALGRVHYFKQQYAEALPLFEYAAQKEETGLNVYLLGELHFRLNNFDAALQKLERAATLAPKDTAPLDLTTQIYLQRAGATQDVGLFAKAVAAGQKLKALRDDGATALLLGQAYLGAKQVKEAIPELKKATEAYPDNGPLQYSYGAALAATEQWLLAQIALEKASQLIANNPAVFNLLGYAYEAEGARLQDEKVRGDKYSQALAAYQQADALAKGADAAIKASIERVKPFAKKP